MLCYTVCRSLNLSNPVRLMMCFFCSIHSFDLLFSYLTSNGISASAKMRRNSTNTFSFSLQRLNNHSLLIGQLPVSSSLFHILHSSDEVY